MTEQNKKLTGLEKLMLIQTELKAPKGQYNSFGKYKFRSAEDILEAVKPYFAKYRVLVLLTDEIVIKGTEETSTKDKDGNSCDTSMLRTYLKATAHFYDLDSDFTLSISAEAREPNEKKGMDSSQITGMASSYARKYALNGLFCIDDTKDADTMDNRDQGDINKKIATMKERIKAMLDKVDPATDTSAFAKYSDSTDIAELTNIGIAVKKLVEQGA